MLKALNNNNESILADVNTPRGKYYCPECKCEVILKNRGRLISPHFAHKSKTNCTYGENETEWHIHMKSLFPEDSIEVRFRDIETGENHVADVFLKDANTVIEFQHSRIDDEEFKKRTEFHLKNGRRMVWVFDESTNHLERNYINKSCFTWKRPRKALELGPMIQFEPLLLNYSVCLYLGAEEDTVYRIIDSKNNYKIITLYPRPIKLFAEMDIEKFFIPEGCRIIEPQPPQPPQPPKKQVWPPPSRRRL